MTEGAWHPVATEHDVIARHVFHGSLDGHELAIWKADDGNVNVWENRCLHRGVRLTVGVNDGAELLCRYHGWRYSNRSGGCTYIPAHPADAPARTITNNVYPVAERYGLIWSTTERTTPADAPVVDGLDGVELLGLRNLAVGASRERVVAALQRHRFRPSAALDGPLEDAEMTHRVDDLAVRLTSTIDGIAETAVFFVQPVDRRHSVVRPVLIGSVADELAVLRHHASTLRALLDRIESTESPPSAAATPRLEETPVSVRRSERPGGRVADITVQVDRKWMTAEGVAAFQLAPIEGTLPAFQPGAHIDVHLPNGLVRQYSLTNAPGDSATYRIGVKLDPRSTGGSTILHDVVRVGDHLEISAPRNNFPLRRDKPHTLLLAGGIGLTPLLAMAQALDRNDRSFDLHCFVGRREELAFAEVVESLGDRVAIHVGLDADETTRHVAAMLAVDPRGKQVYSCGPPGMLAAVRATAAEAGWPDEAVHDEHFDNPVDIDDSSSFEVALARSATTVSIASGTTVLEALRDQGIAVESSCEKGACGSCAVGVIDGVPHHNDVFLTPAERAANDTMLVCVSRAETDRLVLDL